MRTGPHHSRPIRRVNRNQPVARRRQALVEFVGNESVRALMGTGTMSVFANRMLVSAAASLMICGGADMARAQTSTACGKCTDRASRHRVEAPKQAAAAADRSGTPRARVPRQRDHAPQTPPPLSPAAQLDAKSSTFDQSRSNLYTTIGTTSDTISHDTIQDLPQGTNQSVEKVLLQAPGSRRIPPSAARCMSATITPTSNSGSTG